MLVAKILACAWIYVAAAPALKLGRRPRWLLLLNTFLVFDAEPVLVFYLMINGAYWFSYAAIAGFVWAFIRMGRWLADSKVLGSPVARRAWTVYILNMIFLWACLSVAFWFGHKPHL